MRDQGRHYTGLTSLMPRGKVSDRRRTLPGERPGTQRTGAFACFQDHRTPGRGGPAWGGEPMVASQVTGGRGIFRHALLPIGSRSVADPLGAHQSSNIEVDERAGRIEEIHALGGDHPHAGHRDAVATTFVATSSMSMDRHVGAGRPAPEFACGRRADGWSTGREPRWECGYRTPHRAWRGTSRDGDRRAGQVRQRRREVGPSLIRWRSSRAPGPRRSPG